MFFFLNNVGDLFFENNVISLTFFCYLNKYSRMFKLYSQICSIQYHCFSLNSSCSKIDQGLADPT